MAAVALWKTIAFDRAHQLSRIAINERRMIWNCTSLSLDALSGSQLFQLAQGGWVLTDIAKHDPKARPVALKVFEKPFGLRAMGTALADKDLDVRLLTRRLACRAHERAGQCGQDERQDEEPVSDHDSVATQDVS